MYHMWYMYMFMIVMLLTPILYRFKESIDKKTFIKVSWVFFIFACFSRWNTHDVRLEYDLGQGFEYLSFLMLGFCVREKSDYSLKKMGAYLLLGIILLLGVAVIEYEYMICGISESSLRYKFSQPYCPLVAIATFCIFKAFSLLYIKGKWILLQRISSLTFYIYLWHAAIWDFLHRNNLLYSGSDVVNENIIWRIPLYVLVVFILSTILSLFTKTFSRMIKLKYIQ